MDRRIIALLLIFLTVSCTPPAAYVTPDSTPCPLTPTSAASFSDPAPGSVKPIVSTPLPNFTRAFLQALPADPENCLPDYTANDLGVYIYDLKNERELVSINADVPLQFASAFKAPVLVYFLSACRQYWDPASSEWDAYFSALEPAQDVDWFTSPEYEAALADFLANPLRWKDIEDFAAEHRQVIHGAGGAVDTRYFILLKVYSMIAQSSNPATADVLKFIHENCPTPKPPVIAAECGGSNALTEFNAWFNKFSGIKYASGTARRGLYRWDSIASGSQEVTLSTYGLKDECANQSAVLKCDPAYTARNVLTARDFFQFYQRLYLLEDTRLREAAFGLLQVDEPGAARGYLKNMARAMHAQAFSKNGHAFFSTGSINADAGIVTYKGHPFVVVTLSFEAGNAMSLLYGAYDSNGELVTAPGLIQSLLEQVASP